MLSDKHVLENVRLKSLFINLLTAMLASVVSSCGGGGSPTNSSAPAQAAGCQPAAATRPYVQTTNTDTSTTMTNIASCQASVSVSYRWSLVSKPQGSQAALSGTAMRTPAITPDVPGMYLFKMEEAGTTTAERTLVLVAQAAGTSPDLAAHALLIPDSTPKLAFNIKPNLNNQGLAFSAPYFYVGYDVTNGNGMIERYDANGVLDQSYGQVPVPTRHTAELAYRTSDNRLYAASGGGSEPTYVYRLSPDGQAVEHVYDFSDFGNSALLAIDNKNELFLLMTTASGGDKGDPVFRLIDPNNNNSVLLQFSIPNQGVPQGMEILDGIVYFYTNNRITMLDLAGNILGKTDLNIIGESQGMTLVTQGDKTTIAIGYNQPGRVYIF